MSKRENKNNLETWALKNLGVDINKQKSVESLIEEVGVMLAERYGWGADTIESVLNDVIENPELHTISEMTAVVTDESSDIVDTADATIYTDVEEDVNEDAEIDESDLGSDLDTDDTIEESESDDSDQIPDLELSDAEEEKIEKNKKVEESDEYLFAMSNVLNGKKAYRKSIENRVISAVELPNGMKRLNVISHPIVSDASEFIPSIADRTAKDWKVI